MSLVLSGTDGITTPDASGPLDGADIQNSQGNPSYVVHFGYGSATGGSGVTLYLSPLDASPLADIDKGALIIPFGGTMKNLYCSQYTDPSGSETVAYTMFVNGAATALTCTITGGDDPLEASDTVNTAAVSAGDHLTLRIVCSASSPSMWSMHGSAAIV